MNVDPIAAAAARALSESTLPPPASILAAPTHSALLVYRARRIRAHLLALGREYSEAAEIIEELADEYEIAVAQALRLERIVHGATKGERC